jgi:hypothetical protein
MMRFFAQSIVFLVAIAIAAAGGWWLASQNTRPRTPDAAALITQVRDTLKLDVLEVSLYKKVDFGPIRPLEDTWWKELAAWSLETLRRPRGRAIVFANAHLGYDLSRLDPKSIRVQGDRVIFALPALEVRVELLPAETEIIDSNLNTQESAELLEHARKAFLKQVQNDAGLRGRARRSAIRSLEAFLFPLGFRSVQIVDALPQEGAG